MNAGDHFGNVPKHRFKVYVITHLKMQGEYPGKWSGPSLRGRLKDHISKAKDAALKIREAEDSGKKLAARFKFSRKILEGMRLMPDDEFHGFRIRLVKDFPNSVDMDNYESYLQRKSRREGSYWAERVEKPRPKKRGERFSRVKIRGKVIEGEDPLEIVTQLGGSTTTYRGKRSDDLNASESQIILRTLEASEKNSKKWAIEGSQEGEFGNMSDLLEGGTHEHLNENRINLSTLEKRKKKARESGECKKITTTDGVRIQTTEILPPWVLGPKKREPRVYTLDVGGETIEGSALCLHSQLIERGVKSYSGGAIANHYSARNRLLEGDSVAEAYAIEPPGEWKKWIEMDKSNKIRIWPPLREGELLTRHGNGPLPCREYGLVFRKQRSIIDFIQKFTGSDTRKCSKTLKNQMEVHSLDRILYHEGILPEDDFFSGDSSH